MLKEKWPIYEKDRIIDVPGKFNKSIIRALYSIHDAPISNFKTGLSNKIKYALIMLGYEFGYCGYANITKGKSTNKMIRNIKTYIKAQKARFKFTDHSFHNTEWLFDVHWYRDRKNTHFMPEHLYLACESELQKPRSRKKGQKDFSGLPYQAVRYDFQKLLVCNARLRLMIFQVDKESHLYDRKVGLAPYFRKAIRTYKELPKGSSFLFICYIDRKFYYYNIQK